MCGLSPTRSFSTSWNIQVLGCASCTVLYIFACKPGDKVVISGPYGEFFARETDNEIIAGGGAGMAQCVLTFDQFKRLRTTRKVSFWYGGRSFKELSLGRL